MKNKVAILRRCEPFSAGKRFPFLVNLRLGTLVGSLQFVVGFKDIVSLIVTSLISYIGKHHPYYNNSNNIVIIFMIICTIYTTCTKTNVSVLIVEN